jgi:flagellar biosynthetic protein FlhB
MADSSKTEQATPKRRDKAREQGQIARSRELPGVFALAAVAGVMALMAPSAITHWTTLFRDLLYVAGSGDIKSNGPVIFWSAVEVMRWITPILLAALAVSVFTGLMQGGVNIAPGALELKFDRFNPASKLTQIFSPVGLSNLLKSLLPFGAILWISVSVIQEQWETMVHASGLGLRTFASFVGSMIFELAWKSGLVLLTWSAVDYILTLTGGTSGIKRN